MKVLKRYDIAMLVEDSMHRAGHSVTLVFEDPEEKKLYDTNIERWGSQTTLARPTGYACMHTDVAILVGDDRGYRDWMAIARSIIMRIN